MVFLAHRLEHVGRLDVRCSVALGDAVRNGIATDLCGRLQRALLVFGRAPGLDLQSGRDQVPRRHDLERKRPDRGKHVALKA